MPLLHHGITFLDFDGSYNDQKKLTTAFPHHWINFRELRGTSLYCAPEAFRAISSRLSNISDKGLTFLGSGNYHYVALSLLQEMKHPFTLVLIDHHTDLNEGQIGSLLSCGSWVRQAITDVPFLKKVIMIGPNPRASRSVPDWIRRRVVIIPENRIPKAHLLLQLIPTRAIHISIDKDVLSTEFATTNWDQGNLSLATLTRLLQLLLKHKNVESVDICGENLTRPIDRLNGQATWKHVKNERSNLALASQLMISSVAEKRTKKTTPADLHHPYIVG